MKMRFLFSVFAAVALLLMAAVCPAQMGSLRAGAAKVDVTPPKELFPLKSSNLNGEVDKVHDPIYTRALVLDNGKTKLAIVCVDVLDWQIDGLREEIAGALQVPQEDVMLNPTHDDSSLHAMPARQGGNVLDAQALEIMKKGMIEAVRQANANLQPARVGYTTGMAYVNINRNDREGPSDKTLTVITLTKPTGEPIAVYSTYSTHSIVMYQSLTDNGKMQMTSDLAGWTEKYVEEHFPGSVALWGINAGGDQSPLFMSNSKLSKTGDEQYDLGVEGWGLLDAQSRRLGAEIVRLTKIASQNTSGQAVLWAARSSVICPVPVPQPRAPQAGGSGGQQPGGQQAGGQTATAQATAPVSDAAQPARNTQMTIPLQLLMVNDIAIAGLNADPGTEIGIQFRKDSLFERSTLVTMIPNMIGHLQSDKQGCASLSMDQEFQKMMRSYLPVWNAAR